MPSETAISALPPTQNVVTYSYADMTVTISIILAISAIIVPALVSFWNNRKELKLKQLELRNTHLENITQHKTATFEKYLFEAGRLIGDSQCDHTASYVPSYYIALASAPSNIRNQMEYANMFITDRKFDQAASELEEIGGLINTYLETMRTQDKPSKHILGKFCSLVRRDERQKSQ